MGRWRDSWAARNPSVRLAWPMPQTRLPLWFRATGSSALMEVLPDMAAASAGSAGCSFTRGSLWRSLPRDVFQKLHESLKQSDALRTNSRRRREDMEIPPMTDIILHHYDISPYSEKVRTGLGLKGLAWASVELPVIMPKPNLTALTGGYRKTPVLQIGADIYCDSQLIMRELERRYPTPSFYPAGHGAADALAWWAEKTTFLPAVSIAFAKRPDALPEGFLEDRAKFSGRNIDPIAMMAAVPNLLDQLRAHFDWLDQTLADGRSFLQGPAAGLADLAAYHPVWFLRQNFGSAAAPLDGFPRLLTWAERIAAIGHGSRSQMSAQQALDVARDATSIARATVDPQDPIGRKPGQTVTVTPDDTGRDPVVGELVASDVHEIVIRRSDREIGEVCVHFPRAGFVVAPA